jgi:uncharacterized membrane protein
VTIEASVLLQEKIRFRLHYLFGIAVSAIFTLIVYIAGVIAGAFEVYWVFWVFTTILVIIIVVSLWLLIKNI